MSMARRKTTRPAPFISGSRSVGPGKRVIGLPIRAAQRHVTKSWCYPGSRTYDVQMGVRTRGAVAIGATIVVAVFG
jgi:hypothetical protein